MTLQELLNADVSSIGDWARQGFAWWIDELSALLPPALRARLSSRPRRLIEPQAGGGWRHWQNGRPLSPVQAGRVPDAAVGLMLPTEAVLVRRLELPRLPLSDIRRMVALDIDRLSPLAADLIYFDLEIADRDAGEGKQAVLLGIAPREVVERSLDEARASGFQPGVIGAALADGSPNYRFNFLPALKAARGEADGSRVLRYWWAAIGVLLVLNLAGLVLRDMREVDRLRQAVADQQTAVNAALKLRRKVQNEENQRSALLAHQMQNDPLRVLNAVTRAVPASAWVERLEWNGQTLRLVGYKTGEVDMVGVLRASPAFANPRPAAPDTQVKPGVTPPFDITLDVPRSTRP